MTRITRRSLLAAVAFAQTSRADIWTPNQPVPRATELADLQGVRFHVIKAHEPSRDGGYGFLHGVALAWHKGKLYATFGHNKGIENTAGEEARGRISNDGGRTWGDIFTMDNARVDDGKARSDLAVSHGVFLSHGGKLWAFMGSFYAARQHVHTRAYVLDEQRGGWQHRGTAVDSGFWPMQEPQPLPGGNWIMAGFKVGDGEPASVAISRGRDLTKWDQVVIPRAPEVKTMWGESTIIVQGKRVLNIARYGDEAVALTSTSEDGGRTWTAMRPSKLQMVTSKPYGGTLSNGQRYLVGTTTADTGKRRAPLTIAVSAPGEVEFRRIFRIRDAEHPGVGLDSHVKASLSYPYAVEHAGHLYVGYSNNGGRPGMNINSAELAVIPVESLRVGRISM